MVMNKKTYFFPEQQSTFNIWCYQQLQTHGGSTIDVSAVMNCDIMGYCHRLKHRTALTFNE